MDKSSRNTVIFIATITFSAMLLMAAHFYADWQKADTTPAVETAKAESPAIVEQATPEEATPATEEEELPEDEEFPLIGEPMVNIDGDEATSSGPAPLPSSPPANVAPEDAVATGYEANN
jgi:hypothetical protein